MGIKSGKGNNQKKTEKDQYVLKKQRRWRKINGKWYKVAGSSTQEKIKFIPCSEDSQIHNYQRTYKKAHYKHFDHTYDQHKNKQILKDSEDEF